MDNFIVLYNPLAGNGTAQDKMRELESLMQGIAFISAICWI